MTMRAFAVPEFNGTGSVIERPIPTPGEGEILVKVHAAGVNPRDPLVVSGMMSQMVEHKLPLVPGFDYAGTVEALGPGVENVRVGDEVYGAVGKPAFGEGTWAEHATVDAALANRRPEGLDARTAASLPTAGGAALALVDAAGIGPGKTVLVVGANGGVGSFAVQLAARTGATVIAATRPEHAEYARRLGAGEVIDSSGDIATQVQERHPDGVDAVIDTYHDVDGLRSIASAVRPGGRIVSPRAQGAEEAFAGEPVTASVVRAALGDLSVQIEPVRLEDAGRALQTVNESGVRGKLVIDLD